MNNFTAFGPTTVPSVSHAQHSPVLTKKQLTQKYGAPQRAFSTIRKKQDPVSLQRGSVFEVRRRSNFVMSPNDLIENEQSLKVPGRYKGGQSSKQ